METAFYESGRNVLLLMTGIGGTVKGAQNKYERIAERVMEAYRFSVLVAATPRGAWRSMLKDVLTNAVRLVAETGRADATVYAMGNSAGGNAVLSWAYLFPQIKRVLAVNPVLNVNFHWIKSGVQQFGGESVRVVLGENDPSAPYAGILPRREILRTTVLPDADHEFRGNLQSFLDLPHTHLFNI